MDPANRLVAAELERRWNERLAVVSQRQAEIDALDAQVGPSLTAEQRASLLALGADLPRAWHHPQAGNEVRKRILRAAIKEIMAKVVDAQIERVIHWQGGDHSALNVVKNRTGEHRFAAEPAGSSHRQGTGMDANEGTLVSLRSRRPGLQAWRARGTGRAHA